MRTAGGNALLLFSAHCKHAKPTCRKLLAHLARLPASRTFWTAGTKRPINMAIIAMTTRSSIRVNPDRLLRRRVVEKNMLSNSATSQNEERLCAQIVSGRRQAVKEK